MADITKALTFVDGNGYGHEYAIVGKTWFGYCTTATQEQTKRVYIQGFTSEDLVEGTRVDILFKYSQGFRTTSYPLFLDISNSGATTIRLGSSMLDAGEGVWSDGSTIAFVYHKQDNVGYWWMENCERANTAVWGKTKLTNTINSDQTLALTPKAVYDAGYVDAAGAAAAAPVQSVNGQTGAVSLTIPSVPTTVSSFTNDAGYLTLSTLPVWDGSVT